MIWTEHVGDTEKKRMYIKNLVRSSEEKRLLETHRLKEEDNIERDLMEK
jgi:hypothetical protein